MRTLSTQPTIYATPLPPLFVAKAFSFLSLSLAFPGNPSRPYPKPKNPRKSHVMGIQDRTEKEHVTLIFTYGTLKRGFSNHILMQELMRTGDAAFKGTYLTVEKYPLVCGPYRVPFLLNMPGSGNRVMGELYAVSAQGLARLDELEGTTRGHYERLPILVLPAENEDRDFGIDGEISSGCGSGVTSAEAYYAHRSYEKEMWRRNEGKGFVTYSEKEAKGYVKRKDRPQNLTFLDHIRIFVSSPSD